MKSAALFALILSSGVLSSCERETPGPSEDVKHYLNEDERNIKELESRVEQLERKVDTLERQTRR